MTTEHFIEQFNKAGSLFALDDKNQKWRKIASGTLVIISNVHNPSHVILKVIDEHGDNASTAFQCKPKTKPKSNKSYILKGTDTNTNTDHYLAARFKSEDTAASFRMAIEIAAEASQEMLSNSPQNSRENTPKPSLHPRNSSMDPEQIAKRLAAQGPWVCKLCTCRNEAPQRACSACLTPRIHMLQKVVSLCHLDDHSSTGSNQSESSQLAVSVSMHPKHDPSDGVDPPSSWTGAHSSTFRPPSMGKLSEPSSPPLHKQHNLMIASMYGDGSQNGNTPRTPKQFGPG